MSECRRCGGGVKYAEHRGLCPQCWAARQIRNWRRRYRRHWELEGTRFERIRGYGWRPIEECAR